MLASSIPIVVAVALAFASLPHTNRSITHRRSLAQLDSLVFGFSSFLLALYQRENEGKPVCMEKHRFLVIQK